MSTSDRSSPRDQRGIEPPLLAGKDHAAPSIFEPQALLREARRQKHVPVRDIPELCVLDPDGDIVRRLRRSGAARPSPGWACYHTELLESDIDGQAFGILGCAVGAAFAVLVAEQLFASGCKFLLSITSAGQIVPAAPPPYFVLIDRALRDEGTSYHYLPPGDFAPADARLIERAQRALEHAAVAALRGASWTTDAPFRETARAVEDARARGILAVEMEAAGLYAFASARDRPVLCVAHVTNAMGQIEGDFEKGAADGTADALRLVAAIARSWRSLLEGAAS